jgi:dCTP diphosphatase
MTDSKTTVRELMDLVLAFSRDRDWEQFHHPKDLGVALACEVGELLEHFRYRTDAEIRAYLDNPANAHAVSHEVADCLWMILRLADVCGMDLAASLREKVSLAGQKYPIHQVYGKADKYTNYQS